VRERNIRVVYLRPFAHQWDLGKGPLSIEATNVQIVKRIADGVKRDGFKLGGASPIYPFVVQPWLVLLVSLALPAMLLLVLDAFGARSMRWLAVCVAADVLIIAAGYLIHHDLFVRRVLALGAGILFPVAGFTTIAPLVRAQPAESLRATLARSFAALGLATIVTLAGALVVVGLISTPLTMVEVERFLGVKLVLLLPPVIALLSYLLLAPWGAKVHDPAAAAASPVRIYQLLLGVVIVGGAYVLQARSGNQSDIAPSSFELALRAHLTSILSVRPRFKEFLIGYPALMLLPALRPVDRRWAGWLLVLMIGMGLGDLIDTFSHLHTPLVVSALRVVNGLVLGAIAGTLVTAAYRRFRRA
jgi:hypothetical protein